MGENWKFRRNNKIQRRKRLAVLIISEIALISLVLIAAFAIIKKAKDSKTASSDKLILEDGNKKDAGSKKESQKKTKKELSVADESYRAELLDQAAALVLHYDYDGAMAVIQQAPGYEQYTDLTGKLAEYQQTRSTLIEQDVTQIPHFFTHPLIYDAKLAFSSDMGVGYQQESLTVNEFNNFLEQMYRNGYVLVSVHDVATVVEAPDGTKTLQKGQILLPKGKKAFMFSEDDTNYYQRWQQKGVGSRLTIGENGKITCEVDLPDGTKMQGDYDVAPCLNTFIEKHPDFAYKNAKAMIGVTGIEGVLGYRTSKYSLGEFSDSSKDNRGMFNVESEDSKKAITVANELTAEGFVMSSHSFVHQAFYMTNGNYVSDAFVKYDISRFKNEITPLIGPTDVILYPNGADIEHGEDNWTYNEETNPRFRRLKKSGLMYYFTVDTSNSPWARIGEDYFRGRRVGLIGYTVLCKYDYMEENFGLSTKEMVDKDRPVPKVLDYYGTKAPTNCR